MTTDTNTNGYEIGDEILVLAHRMTLAVLRDDGAALELPPLPGPSAQAVLYRLPGVCEAAPAPTRYSW